MAYRKISASYRHFYNETPYNSAMSIKIKLDKNDFDLEDSHPSEEKIYLLDDAGNLADTNGVAAGLLELWCNAGGYTGSKYKVTDPDGTTWEFILDQGDGSEISLMTLRAGGVIPPDPSTINELIDQAGLARYRSVSATSDSLVADDTNKIVKSTRSSATTITVPNTAALGQGFVCAVLQGDTGAVTIAPASGVTLNDGATSIPIVGGKYKGVTIVQAVDAEGNFIADAYYVLGSI